jgi:PAS domain S-box-containing protein
MPLYAFYFCRQDGSAPVFEAHEAASPAAAGAMARDLMRGHPSCAYVTVYEDDDEVLTCRREPPPAPSAASAIYTPAAVAEVLSQARLGRKGAAVIATTPDGDITYWSPAAERLYGWTIQEALGRNVLDVTPALQARAEASAVMQVLREGQSWEGEIVLRNRQGAPFAAYVCDMPVGRVATGDGAIVGVSVPARDRRLIEGSARSLAVELGLLTLDLDRASQQQAATL